MNGRGAIVPRAAALTASVALSLAIIHGTALAMSAPIHTSSACATWAPGPWGAGTEVAASVAYDPATGQLLMFGGSVGGVGQKETSLWTGSRWTLLSPADSPSARLDATMAYDPVTSQLLLFGGWDGGWPYDDTWIWTGTNWEQQSPETSPPARLLAVMSFDTSTSQLILFGGSTLSTNLGDTWIWTGMNWVQDHPSVSPSARQAASMGESRDGQLVLFGGNNNYGFFDDTWTWNGAEWQRRHPSTSPSARVSATVAYDSSDGQLVLFGGGRAGGGAYADTWVWTDSNWAQQHPALSPPATGATALVYDPVTNVLVLEGVPYPDSPGRAWFYESSCRAPGKPSSLSAIATAEGTVELSWSAPASDGGMPITEYEVISDPNCGSCSGISTSATRTILHGLRDGVRYRFAVAAQNVLGAGPSSPTSAQVLVMIEQGYWRVAADGRVFGAGAATVAGDTSTSSGPLAGVVGSLDGNGCLAVTSAGEVRVLGDIGYYGDLPSKGVTVDDIVGIAATPDRRGYWLVGRDGGIFAFGDARYHGSSSGTSAHDIVGMLGTPDGDGYWLVARDGGIFAFGDARFVGSLPGLNLRVSDVSGMAAVPGGQGYVLVGSDGGIFIFGSAARYRGSLPARGVHVDDIVGIAPTVGEFGYWLAGADGSVYSFGNAQVFPATSGVASNLPVTAFVGI